MMKKFIVVVALVSSLAMPRNDPTASPLRLRFRVYKRASQDEQASRVRKRDEGE